MLSPATDPYWSECYRIIRCDNKKYVGKTIFELARERSLHNIVNAVYNESIEVVYDILLHSPDATWTLIKDKREAGTHAKFLTHPMGMPCSDAVSFPANPEGRGAILDIGIPPSAFNMMPSYLLKMVKEEKSLSLNEAIRKITSLPAGILGIKKRGVLSEGNWADLVILDWERLKVRHDFEKPESRPEGIQCVIVNGGIAYQNGNFTNLYSGSVLRKNRD